MALAAILGPPIPQPQLDPELQPPGAGMKGCIVNAVNAPTCTRRPSTSKSQQSRFLWGQALEQAGMATLRADTLHVSRITMSTMPTTPTGEFLCPVTAPRHSHEVRGSNSKAAPQDPTLSSNTNGDHDDKPSSWGETKEFWSMLTKNHLGPAISPGTLPRIQINSTYGFSIPESIFISQPEGYFESGNTRPDSEASNRGGRQQRREPSIHNSREGWRMAPHNFKRLNAYLKVSHFKMEVIMSLRDNISRVTTWTW